MAKVKITETILRDAHQSLIATRMSLDEMLPASWNYHTDKHQTIYGLLGGMAAMSDEISVGDPAQ